MDTTVSNIVTLSESTADATAVSANLLTGKTAYVNGYKITGAMPNNGAVSQTINAGSSYTIPAGYHNGSGKVIAKPMNPAFTTTTLSTTTTIGPNASETKFTLPKSGLVIGSTLFFGAIKTNAVHKCTASGNTQGTGTASGSPSVSGTTLTFPAGGGKTALAMGKSFVVSVTIYYIA